MKRTIKWDKFTNEELVFLHNTLMMRKDAPSESKRCITHNEKLSRRLYLELARICYKRGIVDLWGRACTGWNPKSKTCNTGTYRELADAR